MSDRTDALAQALFAKPSLQACSLQQVDYLAHQYPYFSTAQLLLLQKEGLDAEAAVKQLQRTALHFSNPLQLRYWLEPAVFETSLPEAELFENPMPDTEAEPEIQLTKEPDQKLVEIFVTKETIAEPEQEKAIHPETEIETTARAPENATLPELETAVAPPPENVTQTEAATLSFEPFHTVDYFASQGIKLSQQEALNDTLGKQVKSFTEWLKMMKRIPEKGAAPNVDAVGERKVVNLAVHSLDIADVVTESMAEVWLKQGNTEKAAEVYRKLGLHNPSKSAYFAAKIDSLKQS